MEESENNKKSKKPWLILLMLKAFTAFFVISIISAQSESSNIIVMGFFTWIIFECIPDFMLLMFAYLEHGTKFLIFCLILEVYEILPSSSKSWEWENRGDVYICAILVIIRLIWIIATLDLIAKNKRLQKKELIRELKDELKN